MKEEAGFGWKETNKRKEPKQRLVGGRKLGHKGEHSCTREHGGIRQVSMQPGCRCPGSSRGLCKPQEEAAQPGSDPRSQQLHWLIHLLALASHHFRPRLF